MPGVRRVGGVCPAAPFALSFRRAQTHLPPMYRPLLQTRYEGAHAPGDALCRSADVVPLSVLRTGPSVAGMAEERIDRQKTGTAAGAVGRRRCPDVCGRIVFCRSFGSRVGECAFSVIGPCFGRKGSSPSCSAEPVRHGRFSPSLRGPGRSVGPVARRMRMVPRSGASRLLRSIPASADRQGRAAGTVRPCVPFRRMPASRHDDFPASGFGAGGSPVRSVLRTGAGMRAVAETGKVKSGFFGSAFWLSLPSRTKL